MPALPSPATFATELYHKGRGPAGMERRTRRRRGEGAPQRRTKRKNSRGRQQHSSTRSSHAILSASLSFSASSALKSVSDSELNAGLVEAAALGGEDGDDLGDRRVFLVGLVEDDVVEVLDGGEFTLGRLQAAHQRTLAIGLARPE